MHPIYLVFLICCICLSCSSSIPSAAAEQDFEQWLQKHKAWDVLETTIEESAPPSSAQNILERARLLLKADKPDKSIQLLKKHGPFSDPQLEARRFLYLARASRAANNRLQALLWYSQAAASLPQDQGQDLFASEPNLRIFWKSVWRQWFWRQQEKPVTPGNDLTGQQRFMLQAAGQGRFLWPDDDFWPLAVAVLDPSSQAPTVQSSWAVTEPQPQDTAQAAKLMAAMAVHNWGLARDIMSTLSPRAKEVCAPVLQFLHPQDTSIQTPAQAVAAKYPKLRAYRELMPTLVQSVNANSWTTAAPSLPAWSAFHERLIQATPAEALSILRKERQSALITPEVKKVLSTSTLAYAVLADEAEPERLAKDLSFQDLPLLLKLSLELSGKTDPEAIAVDEAISRQAKQMMDMLHQALTQQPAAEYRLPFWTQIETTDDLARATRAYPLDALLCYAHLSTRWGSEKPTRSLAQEIALLYPETPLAARGLLYLAQEAHEQGKVDLAWRYVNLIEDQGLPDHIATEHLLAKAGLYMETGQEDASFQTYKKLLQKSPAAIPAEKKLKLAVLGQRRGQWSWAQQLLRSLLADKEKLPEALAAETMFWLGEGYQQMKQQEQALKSYLRLAWKYPEHNIWAITAMYRAALIYEQRGQLDTAKSLLHKVVARADRDSQKEAAQARIKAIERKVGSSQVGDEPFL